MCKFKCLGVLDGLSLEDVETFGTSEIVLATNSDGMLDYIMKRVSTIRDQHVVFCTESDVNDIEGNFSELVNSSCGPEWCISGGVKLQSYFSLKHIPVNLAITRVRKWEDTKAAYLFGYFTAKEGIIGDSDGAKYFEYVREQWAKVHSMERIT